MRQGIDGWIEETISGTKNYDNHKLGKLLNNVKKGDLIICSELSRLGRFYSFFGKYFSQILFTSKAENFSFL